MKKLNALRLQSERVRSELSDFHLQNPEPHFFKLYSYLLREYQ